MDFKERKETFAPVAKYLKDKNCNLESLLGLKVHLDSLSCALERNLERVAKNHWKMRDKIKNEDELDWLD